MRSRNQGIPASRISAIAASRGTVVSDWSCRLVKVCTRLSTKLKAAAAISSGAERTMASRTSWRISSATRSGVIDVLSKTLQERVGQQIPSVHHHKKQNLQRRRHHYRRQLEHADRSRDRGRHHVDQQKRQKQNSANGEARLQIRRGA